jgi:Cysteine-rich CPXCG
MIEGRDATCPHCWETINLTLDPSIAEQSYFEDCPVCCRPMIVSYSAEDGEITGLTVEASD